MTSVLGRKETKLTKQTMPPGKKHAILDNLNVKVYN